MHFMTKGELLERYGVNVDRARPGCRECGGTHARKRSEVRCHTRHLRWRRRIRRIRLVRSAARIEMTGEAMRCLKAQMEDHTALALHPRLWMLVPGETKQLSP